MIGLIRGTAALLVAGTVCSVAIAATRGDSLTLARADSGQSPDTYIDLGITTDSSYPGGRFAVKVDSPSISCAATPSADRGTAMSPLGGDDTVPQGPFSYSPAVSSFSAAALLKAGIYTICGWLIDGASGAVDAASRLKIVVKSRLTPVWNVDHAACNLLSRAEIASAIGSRGVVMSGGQLGFAGYAAGGMTAYEKLNNSVCEWGTGSGRTVQLIAIPEPTHATLANLRKAINGGRTAGEGPCPVVVGVGSAACGAKNSGNMYAVQGRLGVGIELNFPSSSPFATFARLFAIKKQLLRDAFAHTSLSRR
jgi:hypothetical protein